MNKLLSSTLTHIDICKLLLLYFHEGHVSDGINSSNAIIIASAWLQWNVFYAVAALSVKDRIAVFVQM